MNDIVTLADVQPANAAQALDLPWLRDKIDSLSLLRHGFVTAGTPPRKHKITDRAARKALARELGRQRGAHLAAGGKLRDFKFVVPG